MTVDAYISEYPSCKSIVDSVNTLLSPLNLKVDEIIKGAQSVKYKLNLPLDLKIQKKIMREEKTIKYALSSAIGTTDFSYGKDSTSVYFEMRSNDFKVVRFNDMKNICKSKSLYLVLGKDDSGKSVYTNLSKAPHILVGGTTGSGKSELLHTFIASLITGMPYTHAELIIVDPKRSEYSPYKNREHITLITEVSNAVNYLNDAVEIMEKRYAELERTKAKDIYRYTGTMQMHPIVIIIDELADLIQTYPEVEKPIVRIAQKSRACGIHLIIGTQSPRKTVVTGLIQTNTPTKIALHTADSLESRIILGKSGAESLLGKGDMIFHGNGAMSDIRIQSAFVDDNTKDQLALTLRTVVHNYVPKENKVWTRQDYYDYYKSIGYDLEGAIQRTHARNAMTSQSPKVYVRGNRIIYDDGSPKRKRNGIISSLIKLWNVIPIMFTSDQYPPKI